MNLKLMSSATRCSSGTLSWTSQKSWRITDTGIHMSQTSIYTYVTQENHNEPLNAVWLWRLCKYTNATCFYTCVRYKDISVTPLSAHCFVQRLWPLTSYCDWLCSSLTSAGSLDDNCTMKFVFRQSLSHSLWQHTILFVPTFSDHLLQWHEWRGSNFWQKQRGELWLSLL